MRMCFVVAVAVAFMCSFVHAELNTVTYVTHDGGGDGRVEGDLTGVGPVTLYDGEGGDLWNGGDQFIYLHDENKVTGDFSATVRVVAQTESVSGRWGKSGPIAVANLTGNGQMAMTAVASGTGSQIDPPSEGGHDPVPVRLHGRRTGDGQNGFEPGINNSAGEITNNVFPESTPGVLNPTTNVSWLRLQYQESTNTFLSAFAPEVDGKPGEWGYSPRVTDVDLPTEEDGPGWYVGLGYSVHEDMDLSNVQDAEGMHGITFDNYSIVPEFLPEEVSVAGLGVGALEISGTNSGLVFGEPETVPGLAQYWFKGNMRPTNADGGVDGFQAVGNTGNETFPLINPGGSPIVTETTWWRGSQGQVLTDTVLPDYPEEVKGFAGWNGNQYGVKLEGEIRLKENGEFLIRDGIDDFTMIAIDADGNGELDELANILQADIAQVGGISIGDVHVLDDDWANLDGSNQEVQYHGLAEIENIGADGDWRRIEIWAAEDGGGDGGIIYIGNLDDPDIFDDVDGGALSQEARDKFAVKQEDLRTTITPVIGGESTASLDTGVHYIMQVGADGSDQIVVDDNDGFLTTTLDVAGATIVVKALEGLTEGTVVSLFGADALTGTDTLNLMFDNADLWNTSDIANGNIAFGDGPPPEPTCADLMAANIPGDADGNGEVAFGDFLALAAGFGTDAGWAGGDFDCSGDVGFNDFLTLANEFGNTAAAAAAVPEPSSVLLVGLGAMLMGLVRRRRR